jgi:hypothetical protein
MYTAGPWHVARVWPTVFSKNGIGVADCRTVDVSQETAFENARLIAAAPELLEACRGILAVFPSGGHTALLNTMLHDVRAAVNKAEGKQ